MSGPKNTVINDPTPFLPPREDPEKKVMPKPSDFAKLGKSRKYKGVDNYLEVRKEYWRHYLPGGETLKELAVKDPKKAGEWAGIASVIIDEIEMLQVRVQTDAQK